MKEYIWDSETGGLLLTTNDLKMSKEPRPVYSQELDILGFDRYWQYPKSDEVPIMWAEGNNYIYRGRVVAQTKGGAPFIAPQIVILEDAEPLGVELRPIDIESMISKNSAILESLVNDTIKKIASTYEKYKKKVDVFYVAFSRGKDSVLVLDLVLKALPNSELIVLFGDTQMEFPDTYKVVEEIRNRYKESNIEFLTAKSKLLPQDTWKLFGPPSQRIRWCCSVHKSTPQILLLRKLFNNPFVKGMAFTGIRAAESANRAEYDDVSFGEKIQGQYSYHPILAWNTAELFLYTFANHLIINDAYKKGNSRAGCLVCPLAGHKNMWFKEQCYGKDSGLEPSTETFNKIILSTTSKEFSSDSAINEFMNIAGWKARRSGRELSFSKELIEERQDDTSLSLTLLQINTSWQEWLKTVGPYSFIDNQTIELIWDGHIYKIIVDESVANRTTLRLFVENSKSEILLKKAFKIAMRKSAYCVCCQVCEANCPFGYITMLNGNVSINDKCIKCRKCHELDNVTQVSQVNDYSSRYV